MKYMRIVAKPNFGGAFIQTSDNKREWKQSIVNEEELEKIICENFPAAWEDYMESDPSITTSDFFYHYGETSEMVRKGESFIFEK